MGRGAAVVLLLVTACVPELAEDPSVVLAERVHPW